jgi:ABC-type protease/lipase transport system fused ATPase/permease subunit
MGKPGCTQAEVEEAARMSNAHTFIETFPARYDTEVCMALCPAGEQNATHGGAGRRVRGAGAVGRGGAGRDK